MLKKKFAFSLAEVLIALGVIGVVAAITLPILTVNVTERMNSERQANIAYKVTQAMEQMRAHGDLTPYESTEAFVDKLQEYLKISKRCDNTHIADCWPTEKVTTADGEEFEVVNAKTGKNLSVGTTTNNVGLVLADGGAIILNYDTATEGLDVGDRVTAERKTLPVGFGKSKEFAYTSSVTAPIDFVMDVNGRKGPNSETLNNTMHDIRSFKVAKFSKGCAGIYISGIGCVVNLGTSYDCISESPYTDNNNCWAGAKAACKKIGMTLPDKDILKSIYSKSSEYPELSTNGANYFSSLEGPSYAPSVAVVITCDLTEYPLWKDQKAGVFCLGD